MSKKWAAEHGAIKATGVNGGEENFSSRNANGTGPFVVTKREPEVRTVLEPFSGWWDKPSHNLTRVMFTKVAAAGTRVAALVADDVDFVTAVPTQSIESLKRTNGIRILEVPELRTIYLGFDHQRDELPDSDVKGRKPLRDKRVREAIYRAIDVNSLRTAIMRGFSSPTNLLVAPGIRGFDPELNQRDRATPEISRKLLAEAGYPDGFRLGMDCPNNRYVNDEAICQAVTTMLARIGIKVDLKAQDANRFFEKVFAPRYDTSFFLLGWTPSSYDAQSVYDRLLHTRVGGTRGTHNLGNYSNPELDALIDRIAGQLDMSARDALIADATRLIQRDFAVVPLHQQVLVWAAKANVDIVQMPDNFVPLRSVRIR
jgi:peptide/nickel transport system substrate-binding protein